MTKQVSYRWRLRELMAARGMWATTDLAPLLEERGIALSPAQVYRLVAQTPERLSLATLAAVCDALACTPADLIETGVAPAQSERRRRRAAAGGTGGSDDAPRHLRPKRAQIIRSIDP
jgi:DNA-binding Xre family transcriptional regulator